MASLSSDPLANGMRALSQFFIGEATLSDVLTEVTSLACTALAADMAGITMLVEGRPRTGAFTEAEAVAIDVEQYETGRGPCMTAFSTQGAVRIDETRRDQRWPEFAAAAAAHGIQSTLSLPLFRTGEPLGALNLYSRQPAHFVDVDTTQAEMLAAQAAILLVNASAFQDARALSENLSQALVSRSTIDQAVGIILSSGGRNPAEAFQVLVRASQRENRKLRDIAADLVLAAETRQPLPGPGLN